MKKIALFGGSFNPIHNGHLEIAKEALCALSLNEIIFIPANISPLKNECIDENKTHRLKMLELALKNYTTFSISDFELTSGGTSFSINTITHFLKKLSNTTLFFLMGEDSFQTIEHWKAYEKILNSINIVIFPRDGSNFPDKIKTFPQYKKNQETDNYLQYSASGPFSIYFLKSCNYKISSSFIRKNINNRTLIEKQLPEHIYNYILKTKLYST